MSEQNFVCLGPHPPGRFYGPPVPSPVVRGVPAGPPAASVHGGRGRGRRGSGRGVAAGRGPRHVPDGRSHVRDDSNAELPKSYDDPDDGNTIPPFRPSRPAGVHFERPLLRRTMTTAVEFFQLFFTIDMIDSIVTHTNSYAHEHIFQGTHSSYAKSDGSWQDVTADEIKRLIALLIYFGLVKVVGDVDKYWSVKSLYHGLWAREIMSRTRYKALMALLHVVDPATETEGDKLRKVESFVAYFKNRCSSLYQPRQQVAIDE